MATGALAVTALPVAALASADPTFALIENHRRIMAEWKAIAGRASDEEMDANGDRAWQAEWALVDNPPTTIAGIVALLRYACERRSDGSGFTWDDGSTGLDDEDDWRIDCVWEHRLEAAIAEVLERITRTA
jgi:hypothetical protein